MPARKPKPPITPVEYADYPIARRPPPAFYHGGTSGLQVGDLILPGGAVGMPPDDLWYCSSDPDFCFITIDIVHAWHNALLCEETRGAGAVYSVDPVGRLRLDLCGTGRNFAVRRARVLEVLVIPPWARAAFKAGPMAFGDLGA